MMHVRNISPEPFELSDGHVLAPGDGSPNAPDTDRERDAVAAGILQQYMEDVWPGRIARDEE